MNSDVVLTSMTEVVESDVEAPRSNRLYAVAQGLLDLPQTNVTEKVRLRVQLCSAVKDARKHM